LLSNPRFSGRHIFFFLRHTHGWEMSYQHSCHCLWHNGSMPVLSPYLSENETTGEEKDFRSVELPCFGKQIAGSFSGQSGLARSLARFISGPCYANA
jgi:hypothetical protein